MDEKENIKKNLQQAINELKNIMIIQEPIKENWNDEIANTFINKYKSIESEIDKLTKELEDLQKLL